jgi:chemotaxis signal transduction protein
MTVGVSVATSRAEELKREFDRSFAVSVEVAPQESVDFVGLRIAGVMYAMRTSDISGLHADTVTTPLPSPVPQLIGLAGFRGGLMPVYDLAALLGFAPGPGRWMAVDGSRSVALRFSEFVDHFRVEASAIVAQPSSGTRHVHQIVRRGQSASPIIDIPSLIESMKLQVASLHKEH